MASMWQCLIWSIQKSNADLLTSPAISLSVRHFNTQTVITFREHVGEFSPISTYRDHDSEGSAAFVRTFPSGQKLQLPSFAGKVPESVGLASPVN